MNNNDTTIEWWLADLRQFFINTNPKLIALFDIYAAEALFGRQFIMPDLDKLQPGAKILEVGAGSLLLSCQLAREGFDVTALEPVGIGFSHFAEMRQIVLTRATVLQCLPLCLNVPAEELAEPKAFDFAFSINVMEHVHDISKVITNIADSLKDGATYHFTSPNYFFPYEPHFNIPTLFSKRLTERIFRNKIFCCKKMDNPHDTWYSINWINVHQIRKIARQWPEWKVTFNRNFLATVIGRITLDSIFAGRRSHIIRQILSILVRYRIHRLFRFIPSILQPVIDCSILKSSNTTLN